MIRNISCPTCGRLTPDASFCEYCGRALYSCKACKATIPKQAMFCPECGKAVTEDGRELRAQERVSWAWWLLPILPGFMFFSWVGLLALGWIGGLIAWAFNRNRDPEKARNILWLGLSLLIIAIVVSLVFSIIGETLTPIERGG